MNHLKPSRPPSLTSMDGNSKMGGEHIPTATQPSLKQKSHFCPPRRKPGRIQGPGTFPLAAENEQHGSGLFSVASSSYLICSPKQKLPARGWESTAGCPCCQGSPDMTCLLSSSFLCHCWKFSQTWNVLQLQRVSSSSPALLSHETGAAAQSRAGFYPPGDGHLQVSVSKDSLSAEGQRAAGFSLGGAGSGISKGQVVLIH